MINEEFWQTRIKIKKIPNRLANNNNDESWLYNFFSDLTTYGTEITLGNSFTWEFFLKADSEFTAIKRGNLILMSLKSKFKGLVGEIEVKHITSEDFYSFKQNKFYELTLPRLPEGHIRLMQKIIDLFNYKAGHLVKIYIFWQMDDSRNVKNEKIGTLTEYYKLKVFITGSLNYAPFIDEKRQRLELEGKLHYLALDIQDSLGNVAELKDASSEAWKNILNSNVFWQNDMKEVTGSCYSFNYEDIPKPLLPCFVKPEMTDFTFSNDLQMDKSFNLENENIVQRSVLDGIDLGNIISNGNITDQIASIPIDDFVFSLLIFGKSGSGKTFFCGNIVDGLCKKAPKVGIVILNYAKEDQEKFYPVDEVIKFGTKEFRIPYFVSGKRLNKSIKETAKYLAANIGMKNVVPKIIARAMQEYYDEHRKVPTSLIELFNKIEDYMDKHQYSDELQTNLKQAIENRVHHLIDNPEFEKSLRIVYDKNNREVLPEWFIKWRKGGKIFLDLSDCEEEEKHLLTNAIFRMINDLTSETMTDTLKNLVIIDEAHEISHKSYTTHPDDGEYIMKIQMEKQLSNLLLTHRSRGLGVIIIDTAPKALFESVIDSASIKILFRLGYPHNELFTSDKKEQRYLRKQGNRCALIDNGVTGDYFLFRTSDFTFSDHKDFERFKLSGPLEKETLRKSLKP